MSKQLNTRIQHKYDITDNWDKASFTPLEGELLVYAAEGTEPPKIKIGDGNRTPAQLPFVTSSSDISISDAVDSADSNVAASSLAVKTAYDKADEALSKANSAAKADHTHGYITNDGKIGRNANRAVYTYTEGVLTAGTLPIPAGGTGVTSNPSMLTDLGSTTAASVFAATPRPGVTGTLSIANGGTEATTASDARDKLGITLENLGITAGTQDLEAGEDGNKHLDPGKFYFVYE